MCHWYHIYTLSWKTKQLNTINGTEGIQGWCFSTKPSTNLLIVKASTSRVILINDQLIKTSSLDAFSTQINPTCLWTEFTIKWFFDTTMLFSTFKINWVDCHLVVSTENPQWNDSQRNSSRFMGAIYYQISTSTTSLLVKKKLNKCQFMSTTCKTTYNSLSRMIAYSKKSTT